LAPANLTTRLSEGFRQCWCVSCIAVVLFQLNIQ
jgi:hypothetical protein